MFESLKNLWLNWKNKPTQDQIARREEELALARVRMAIARMCEYPEFKRWLYWKIFLYWEEAQSKKDFISLYKADVIDEIINEIESAEKFVIAEEKNLASLRNKKEAG